MAADLIAAASDEKTFARHPRLWARIRRRQLKKINWKVDVNKDWRIHAYSRYDGEIRVSIGSLYLNWKDADVATILGHEVAHVIAGHAMEQLKKRACVSVLLNFTEELLDVPGDKIAWEAWEALYMRPHYLRRELEADRIGLLLLAAAGYDPRVAPNHWFSKARFLPATAADYDDLAAMHPPRMIRGQKLLHTKVMNEALELYAQALRSGKSSGPLDSLASALKLQLACCKFWIVNWLRGVWASLPLPNLWNCARDSVRGSNAMALPANKRWSQDIARSLQHDDVLDDAFLSQWNMPGAYCANSALRVIFQGDMGSSCAKAKLPWECWAPLKVKHMVQSHKECLLCNRDPELAAHIAFNCSFAKEVWWSILSWVGMPIVLPPAIPSVDVWWEHLRSLLPEDKRKALDTLFVLIVWHLWLERYARLLGEEKVTSAQLSANVEQEALEWIGAGAKDLGSLLLVASL
ncbi:hypothetical protein HU200_046944 [Digitaria exilis]|uniref:Peptidase M48 domain-containing protein n=1 Tax=Digitaria exilis TaxID=1010633 RepID=A0A835B0A8_9POAL|nr:hypothetical protein HU200_046944 [Digitaria exilis]